jgi:hypothetical protein
MTAQDFTSEAGIVNYPVRSCVHAQNEYSRLVIRRIFAGQVVSIITASSLHPHIPASDFLSRHPELDEVKPRHYRETTRARCDGSGAAIEGDGGQPVGRYGNCIVPDSGDDTELAAMREEVAA